MIIEALTEIGRTSTLADLESLTTGGAHAAHAANVVRAGLTEGRATRVGESFAVLGLWAVAAWLVTAWVVGRRR